MKISFICTGGTIDKDYALGGGVYNFEIAQPAVKRILSKIRPNFEFEIIEVLKKDSLDITEEDRQKVFDACKKLKNDKIIITHGTDTMVKTAGVLSSLKGKTIVLVGASKPEKFYDSDASFNLGFAVGAVSALSAGVYVAMNGRLFEWSKVMKDKKTGRFIDA